MTKKGSLRFLFCLLVLAVVSLIPSGAQSAKKEKFYKTTSLGPYAVSVVCTNNETPTGRILGNTGILIISCAHLKPETK